MERLPQRRAAALVGTSLFSAHRATASFADTVSDGRVPLETAGSALPAAAINRVRPQLFEAEPRVRHVLNELREREGCCSSRRSCARCRLPPRTCLPPVSACGATSPVGAVRDRCFPLMPAGATTPQTTLLGCMAQVTWAHVSPNEVRPELLGDQREEILQTLACRRLGTGPSSGRPGALRASATL